MTSPVNGSHVEPVEEPSIKGWDAIAAAAGKAIRSSVSVSTAKRYASPGRDNRLPVYQYQTTHVHLAVEDLALWAKAFLRRRPLHAKPAGTPKRRAA